MQASILSLLQTLASRSRRLVANWHNIFLTLGCTFVLLLLVSSYWQASASLKALGDLRRQAERVEHLDSMLIQLMDAENAVRGFLLSGNRAYLEPYEKTKATVNHTLETIRQDLDPDPSNNDALADLSGLVAIKIRSLDNAVVRGMAGEEVRAQGKRYTDRIRDRIVGLQAQLAAEGHDSFLRSTQNVKHTRRMVFTLAAGTLILMGRLFIVVERQFKLREQIAGLLQSENQRLDALVQERTGELNDLASYLTNVREAEKLRLARELHDELGALLTAAKMESGWIFRLLDGADLDACRERLARLEEFLDSGIAIKRRIIDGLRPALLEDLGLTSTLRTLGEEFAQGAEETVIMDLPEADIDIGQGPALALFRIAQEALTNIRKHAHARQIRLALRETGGMLELEIKDDGIGFPGSAHGRHHGLAGMKHRVQMCGGEFTLVSQPGAGTRIIARIPLVQKPQATIVDQEGMACRT